MRRRSPLDPPLWGLVALFAAAVLIPLLLGLGKWATDTGGSPSPSAQWRERIREAGVTGTRRDIIQTEGGVLRRMDCVYTGGDPTKPGTSYTVIACDFRRATNQDLRDYLKGAK